MLRCAGVDSLGAADAAARARGAAARPVSGCLVRRTRAHRHHACPCAGRQCRRDRRRLRPSGNPIGRSGSTQNPAAPQEPARRARLLTPSCAPWRRPADPLSGAVVAAAVRAVACVALAAALPVGPAEPPWAGGALLDAGLSCCAAVLMRLSPAALWRWGVPACLALHAAASAPKARACA